MTGTACSHPSCPESKFRGCKNLHRCQRAPTPERATMSRTAPAVTRHPSRMRHAMHDTRQLKVVPRKPRLSSLSDGSLLYFTGRATKVSFVAARITGPPGRVTKLSFVAARFAGLAGHATKLSFVAAHYTGPPGHATKLSFVAARSTGPAGRVTKLSFVAARYTAPAGHATKLSFVAARFAGPTGRATKLSLVAARSCSLPVTINEILCERKGSL